MPLAILFDLYGTLATDPPTAHADALKRALAAARVDVPLEDALAGFDAEASRREGERPEERFRSLFSSLGLRPRIVKSAAADAARRYTTERMQQVRLFPEVEGALAALPGGARVAVVSNFPDGDAFRRLLDRLRLSGRLDAAVCSEDAGARKPDPAPFLLALERMEAVAGEAVVVGDGADDVEGAARIGARSVLVHRGDGAPSVEADAVVRGLGELPDALARLGFR